LASAEIGNAREGCAGVKIGRSKLLIVEDDPGLQRQLKWCFDGYEVLLVEDRASAIACLRRHEPAVVLQDLGLPPDPNGVEEGLAALQEILRVAPHTKVIVVTGQQDRDSAVRAISLGAADFYQKPVDTEILRLIVDRAFYVHGLEARNRLLACIRGPEPILGIIATSEPMMRLCRTVEKVAPTTATTLLLGESGTGKELIARALHALSPRSDRAFVALNCAAIPEALLESELFGHEKGAFTGAVRQAQGKFELADGGTLFLDEIGDMSMQLQAKLLRFLQERVVERVGGREIIPVDVRVICATNKDIEQLITRNAFREDLFYRISEVTLRIPPLRSRPGDAAVLAQAIMERCAREHGRVLKGFTPAALQAIQAHGWPGNVRELENRISAAVIMAEGKYIGVEELGLAVDPGDAPWLNLREARSRAENEAVRQALAITRGNLSKAAELLGVTRPTLYDLIDKLGIEVADVDVAGGARTSGSVDS
jgi:two-component system NtrC family response regulator